MLFRSKSEVSLTDFKQALKIDTLKALPQLLAHITSPPNEEGQEETKSLFPKDSVFFFCRFFVVVVVVTCLLWSSCHQDCFVCKQRQKKKKRVYIYIYIHTYLEKKLIMIERDKYKCHRDFTAIMKPVNKKKKTRKQQ